MEPAISKACNDESEIANSSNLSGRYLSNQLIHPPHPPPRSIALRLRSWPNPGGATEVLLAKIDADPYTKSDVIASREAN